MALSYADPCLPCQSLAVPAIAFGDGKGDGPWIRGRKSASHLITDEPRRVTS